MIGARLAAIAGVIAHDDHLEDIDDLDDPTPEDLNYNGGLTSRPQITLKELRAAEELNT